MLIGWKEGRRILHNPSQLSDRSEECSMSPNSAVLETEGVVRMDFDSPDLEGLVEEGRKVARWQSPLRQTDGVSLGDLQPSHASNVLFGIFPLSYRTEPLALPCASDCGLAFSRGVLACFDRSLYSS